MTFLDMSAMIDRWGETVSVVSVVPAHWEGDTKIAETRETISLKANIQPITGKMQRNDAQGTYQATDKVMYALESIEVKSIVTYKEQEYEVMDRKDYSGLGNYYQYVLRGTSYL